jgi:eukaryotic-like serine/threonine-protein kinase
VTKIRDFVGPYRLTRLVRAGHSCHVWEAVKDETGERFALKMLKPDSAENKEEIGYLRHEWEVAKDLNHPNIIRFYGFHTQYHSPFLVLELFAALNLKQALREGPEPIAYLAEKIIQQTAKALHYLHERKWIHCDVKPDNLLVDDDGNVKLIDFTISQRPKRNLLSFLGFKQPVRGTRSYMSPEQIRGETLDRRSDVYSLGCVFFELLGGRPPFTGSSPNELLEKHLRASIPAVMVYNKDVSRECSDLLRRMMSKRRESRPKSMWDVLQEFRALQLFSKKPQPPKHRLSEMNVGPVTDVDALKQLPKASAQEENENEG